MLLKDLGFNEKTGWHNKRLTHVESVFVGILWVDHVGRENAIAGDVLAWQFARGLGVEPWGSVIEEWKRDVRYMQNHLLFKHDHIPVMSMAGWQGGYWIAETEEEGNRFFAAFRKRAMTGFLKGTRGRRAAMVEAVEQIAFEFEEMVDKFGGQRPEVRGQQTTKDLAPEIVDALLRKMSEDPVRFAGNLRNLREKYFSGAVVLKKENLAAMQEKAAELQALIGAISG